MTNPFEPPPANPFEAPRTEARSSQEAKPIDVMAALQVAWNVTWPNLGAWIGISIVGGILSVLSVVTVIGMFLALPVIMYGFVKFVLNTVDGEAEFNDLFSGFQRFGWSLGAMLGLGVLFVLITLPGQVPSYIGLLLGNEDLILIGQLVGWVVSSVWSAVVVLRFYLAPYFIVDRGMGPVESLRASWEMTSASKLQLVVFWAFTFAITLAGLLIPPLLGLIPASLMTGAGFAAIYRQLMPKSPPSALT